MVIQYLKHVKPLYILLGILHEYLLKKNLGNQKKKDTCVFRNLSPQIINKIFSTSDPSPKKECMYCIFFLSKNLFQSLFFHADYHNTQI